MIGSGLRRYFPDNRGGGFAKGVAKDILSATLESAKKEVPYLTPAIKRVYASGRRAAVRGVKKRAAQSINKKVGNALGVLPKRARRSVNDLFGV